jgi:hypothetical protein
MAKFFQIIITKLYFKLLFGLLQLHFFYINIQCIEFNKSIINKAIFFEKNFRYLSFASYSNGDMIFSSTANPNSEKRIFYGIKKNGRPFFKNETSYFYSMSKIGASGEEKFESDSLVIKLSDGSEKEYLISTGKGNSYAEIYDFENNETYKKSMDNFAKNNVVSLRNMGIFLLSNTSGHYYLFGFIIKESDSLKYSLQIHNFNTIENFNKNKTLKTSLKGSSPYYDIF